MSKVLVLYYSTYGHIETMANKMARIAWAVITRGEVFQPGYAAKLAA